MFCGEKLGRFGNRSPASSDSGFRGFVRSRKPTDRFHAGVAFRLARHRAPFRAFQRALIADFDSPSTRTTLRSRLIGPEHGPNGLEPRV